MLQRRLDLSTASYSQYSHYKGVDKRQTLRCQAAADSAAAAATQPADIVQQLLTRRSYAPPRYVGPIKVSEIPGKRYGLTATQNLPVGSLLLVVPPLVAAYGEGGAAPANEELVTQLDGQQLLPWQLQWLRLLYREPAAAAAAAVEDRQLAVDDSSNNNSLSDDVQGGSTQQQHGSSSQLALLQQLLLQGDSFQQTPPADNTPAAAAAIADSSIASITCPFSTQQLQQLIAENAYSEASEDIGASLLRELSPESVTGLWPEFALLNHSCAPNTVAVVVGQYLLLRAAAPVLAGEELSCSYLGQKGLAPVVMRRAYLQGVYGFHCQCARCMAEQSTFPTAYYPADNALLGIVDPNKPSGSSSSSSSDNQQQQQQQQGGLLDRALGLIGLGSSSSKGQQLQPSEQHQLLLQLHAESADLQAAVQEAVTADSRRTDRQLALLQQISNEVDVLLDAVANVLPQLQGNAGLLEQASPQVAARWLLASAQPLLQLQVELIELLLASGQLPVAEGTLYDDVITGRTSTGSSTSRGIGSGRMAAAGAAAAARLSLSRGRSKRAAQGSAQSRGLGAWVSNVGSSWGLGSGSEEDAGPVTKRQLLALYVDALECNLQVVDAVARGSEVHIVLALKHMDAVRQLHGGESDEVRLAEGLCSRAHAARYGVLPQRLLAALLSARRRQLLGASLARKMSVLAWEGAVTQE